LSLKGVSHLLLLSNSEIENMTTYEMQIATVYVMSILVRWLLYGYQAIKRNQYLPAHHVNATTQHYRATSTKCKARQCR